MLYDVAVSITGEGKKKLKKAEAKKKKEPKKLYLSRQKIRCWFNLTHELFFSNGVGGFCYVTNKRCDLSTLKKHKS